MGFFLCHDPHTFAQVTPATAIGDGQKPCPPRGEGDRGTAGHITYSAGPYRLRPKSSRMPSRSKPSEKRIVWSSGFVWLVLNT